MHNIEAIWHKFINKDNFNLEEIDVSPYIKEAWLRCRRQLKHNHWPTQLYAKGVTYESLCRSNSDLINISAPLLEDIIEYITDIDYAFALTDSTGCTLNLYANPNMTEKLSTLGIRPGIYWREAMMGNNAINSALIVNTAITIKGFEHFNSTLHQFAMYAVPIFDQSNSTIGVISFICLSGQASSIFSSLTHSIAQQITIRLYNENILIESNRYLSEIHILLDGVEEGVLAWNENGIIHYLNKIASDLLKIKAEKILGQNINNVIKLPQKIINAISENKEVDFFETSIEFQHNFISLAISLRIVKGTTNSTNRYMALLHPIDKIRDMVHKHGSSHARLTFDDIDYVGNSVEIKRVVRLAHQAAKGRGSILLRGEEGLGKTYLAQAIHNASERNEKPFISINCQAIPREAMANEFLGIIGNSETTSVSKLELAKGGTLLLENVECLTIEVQAAILQLLKTGLLNKLNHTIIPLDIRLITTTDVDINQYVVENRFRRHLLYEIQSFDIYVPPLRERTEDIPILVKRYLMSLSDEMHKKISITDDALELLVKYQWPGNNRELRNVLEKSYSYSDGNIISVKDLPSNILVSTDNFDNKNTPIITIEDMEKNTIINAAIYYKGKASFISKNLNISRTSLWRKIKAYNINLNDYK